MKTKIQNTLIGTLCLSMLLGIMFLVAVGIYASYNNSMKNFDKKKFLIEELSQQEVGTDMYYELLEELQQL